MRVKDTQVKCVWESACDCGETAIVTPDWYEDNGTPICPECGEDMTYSHTEVEDLEEEKAFTVGDNVIVTNDDGHEYQATVADVNLEDLSHGIIGVRDQEDDYYDVDICQVRFDQ